MRRLILGSLLLVAASALAQSGKPAAKKNTVPPPKWDKRTLDAFFADARQHVGPGKPGGAPGAASSSSSNTSAAASTNAPAPATTAGGFAWSKYISGETLESEIKANVNVITEAVDIPGKFKAGRHNDARKSFTVLAAMFGVIAQYDGDVKWKDKAAGLRDLTGKSGVNCKVGTEASFTDAKHRYEELSGLLSGTGVDVPAGERLVEWASVTEISPLMKRMEDSFQNKIMPMLANKGDFTAGKDELIHESQVLAVLGQVIQHESFAGYGDDENFRKHAAQLQQGCLDILDGIKLSSYEKAQSGAALITKACSNCHEAFR